MRHNRRMTTVNRKQPQSLLHGWWKCDEITNGVIPNAAGGDPLIVQNTGSPWSIAASGQFNSRVSKSAQTSAAFIYGDGPLFDYDSAESFSIWGWIWPDSADLTSDGFTKPFFGASTWAASESGFTISCYFNNISAIFSNARDGSSTLASSMFTLGTVGTKIFLALKYDVATRKISGSKNGAAFVTAAGALSEVPFSKTNVRFNLGNYVLGNTLNPSVTAPDSRNMMGKWDEIGWMRKKALSDADVSWLYNSGTGRTYEESADFGLFRP